MAGRIYHWKHGWIPLDSYAELIKSGRKVETIKATAAVEKTINDEMTRQGLSAEHPMRGVLARRYGTHFVVARDDKGRIVGGIGFDKRRHDVEINEVRVLNDVKRTGIGHKMIAEAARNVGPNGEMRVYGAVSSAKPFYAKTGASFRSGSALGTWSKEAVDAMKRGERPPPGSNPTELEFRTQEAEDLLRQYPDYYREQYGSLTPAQVGRRNVGQG